MSLVRKWREANPSIVDLWKKLDDASKESVRYHRPICVNDKLLFETDDTNMTIKLPSGRKLFYRHPSFANKQIKGNKSLFSALEYEGIVQETKQWGKIDTYGGKLTENVTQGIARDLLANSMLNIVAAGYNIVGHIHDEVIVEVPKENAKEHYDEVVRVMSIPPDWAKDIPLNADGYITPFYLKD